MSIAELAAQLNTTPVTIYRRLKRNGVAIGDLRDSETNELTDDGVSIIASMFDDVSPKTASQEHNSDISGVLQAQIEGQRALIEQLQGERDELRRQLAMVTAALEREQADRQAERLLLLPATPQRGFFSRLFGVKSRNTNTT